MPFKCCVPNCRGNYDADNKVHVFTFPNAESTRKAWMRAIHREDFVLTKNSKVCERHFAAKDIEWLSTAFDEKSGHIVSSPLQRPRLKSDAIPSIFPSCPTYLSIPSVSSRVSPTRKRQNLEEQHINKAIGESMHTHAKYISTRSFSTFEELCSTLQGKDTTSEFWKCMINTDNVMFLNLIINNDNVELKHSVLINQSLQLFVSYEGKKLSKIAKQDLPMQVKNVNEIEDLLGSIEELYSSSKSSTESIISIVKCLLLSLKDNLTDNYNVIVDFIVEQISFLSISSPERYRYSTEMLIFSAMFFLISPQAYRFIRKVGKVILPHPSTIKKISSKINISPQKDINDLNFLDYAKQKVKELKDYERYVSLMMDEIHIKQFLDYKGGDIVGTAYDSKDLANSAYVFMVQSLLSQYRDVVHILPTNKMSAELLFQILKKLIIGLEKVGFKVIVVVSDNNSINRKCMKHFNNPLCEYMYPHPCDAQRPLFYCVDTVHLIKCVRNNWINQKNPEQAMYYPSFNLESTEVHTASFLSVKKLYEVECGELLKYGYTLSRKALWPTNLERQNVKLALQVFNREVANSLKEIGERCSILNNEHTSNYIDIFHTWFKIVNVKTPHKGIHAIDDMLKPLSDDESDKKMVFLSNFLMWLKKWRYMQSDAGRLTNETLSALLIATECIMQLTKYCTLELSMQYLLPGKIQTDELEHRFGLYRRMAGANYHISIRQVFEIENKMRSYSLLKLTLNSKSKGIVIIEDFADTDISLADTSVAEPVDDALNEVTVKENDMDKIAEKMSLITYLAGYCIHSVLKIVKCIVCKEYLVRDVQLPDHVYFKHIHTCDRGGLLYPSSDVINIIAHNFIVVQKLISGDLESKFLLVNNQRTLVSKITLHILSEKDVEVMTCSNHSSSHILKFLVRACTNTLLKNYCKDKNDALSKVQNKRKLSTLDKKKNRNISNNDKTIN